MKSTSYTLTGTTFTIQRVSLKTPLSVAFTSADATRKIELSFDGGTEYHNVVADLNYTSATQLVLAVLAPFTNIKVTGAIGDVVTISSDTE